MSDSTTKATQREKRSQLGRRIFRIITGNTTFALMLTIACTIAFFLIWNRVAVSLLQEAGLPVGISPQLPTIDANYVQQVNEQRDQRVGHRLRDYSRFKPIFIK